MIAVETSGRANQRRRTRKDLLQAASRLIKQGRQPSLEEIAETALVSRATAYRYFANVDALLLEASLDVALPEAGELFAGSRMTDPVERMLHVDAAVEEMIAQNEPQLRMMLAHSLTRRDESAEVPRRQNRRTPLIEAALEPAEKKFAPTSLDTLKKALALVVGTESMVVCKDVLQLDDASARKVRRWAIRALVEAARRPG